MFLLYVKMSPQHNSHLFWICHPAIVWHHAVQTSDSSISCNTKFVGGIVGDSDYIIVDIPWFLNVRVVLTLNCNDLSIHVVSLQSHSSKVPGSVQDCLSRVLRVLPLSTRVPSRFSSILPPPQNVALGGLIAPMCECVCMCAHGVWWWTGVSIQNVFLLHSQCFTSCSRTTVTLTRIKWSLKMNELIN